MDLLESFCQLDSLKKWLKQTVGRQLVTGLSASAKPLAMVSYFKTHEGQLLIVAPNLFYANQLLEDLRHLVEDLPIYHFPVDEVLAAEMAFASPEARSERVETLHFLLSKKPGIVVTTVAGVKKILPDPEVFQQFPFDLKVGAELDLELLPEKLVLMGYTRESLVSNPGEFAVRGSIVDIYPLTTDYPVRMELFDTEIDSLRYFNPEDQRSLEKIEEVTILPTTEAITTREDLEKGAEKLKEALEKRLSTAKKEEKKELKLYFEEIMRQWQSGENLESIKLYPSFIYEKQTTLIDYFNEPTVFIDDLSRGYETDLQMETESAQWFTQKLEDLKVLPEQVMLGDFRQFIKKTAEKQTIFSLFQKGMGNLKFDAIYPVQMRSMQQFFGQLPLLKAEMDRWQKQQQTVVVMVPTKERLAKVEELLREVEIPAVVSSKEVVKGKIQIQQGSLQAGFEMLEDRLVVITEREIFHSTTKKKRRQNSHISNAERIKSYTDLKPGDYVVHANHGIGQYMGMQTLKVDGIHQDYITIVYQNDDQLFIPVTQLDLIQKYVSSESKTPKINKLGGSEWTKTKRKVAAKIEDIADELIELYAKREAEKGYAFSKDDSYQQQFEADFPYSETDDQLRSIQEIKHDMEKSRPMDRLLVGDVGYGKTEVALRAAFKAIQDHKQVAFLVPTTILAQQHFETMEERFHDYPVTMGMLSRFRTKKQQKEKTTKRNAGRVKNRSIRHYCRDSSSPFKRCGICRFRPFNCR